MWILTFLVSINKNRTFLFLTAKFDTLSRVNYSWNFSIHFFKRYQKYYKKCIAKQEIILIFIASPLHKKSRLKLEWRFFSRVISQHAASSFYINGSLSTEEGHCTKIISLKFSAFLKNLLH